MRIPNIVLVAALAAITLVSVVSHYAVHKDSPSTAQASHAAAGDRGAALFMVLTSPKPARLGFVWPLPEFPVCNTWSRGELVRVYPWPVMICTPGNGWQPVACVPANAWIEVIERVPLR